jgi:cyclophilin family peptidyl-prolyl cis-trans isomerase
MTKIFVLLAGVLLVAQTAVQPPLRVLTPNEHAIIQQQVTMLGEPLVVLNAEKGWAASELLWPLLQMDDSHVQTYTLRAIGRLEDPRNVRALLGLTLSPDFNKAALGRAIVQSLNGFDPSRDPELIEDVATFLRRIISLSTPSAEIIVPEPAGMVRYLTAEQVHAVEKAELLLLERSQDGRSKAADYLAAARALESLARLNAQVTAFDPTTLRRLSRMVAGTWANDGPPVRRASFNALVFEGALDAETERRALRDGDSDMRRLATMVLAVSGGGLEPDERLDAIQDRLSDDSAEVRYEALKGYIRHSVKDRGCQPVYDLLDDHDTHVALVAIDAFGSLCLDDQDITKRFLGEAKVPPPSGPWHRETHAFVTLAKRDRENAATLLVSFVTHPNFWVRIYAVQAAVALGDTETLNKLAYDKDHNVREAALSEMAELKRPERYEVALTALGEDDLQLVRTAALILKGSRVAKLKETALAALLRLTKQRKETSRDARLPLLDLIALSAGAADAREIEPLLKDFDPKVAAAAGDVIAQLTGKPAKVEPQPVAHGWPIQFPDLRKQCVSVAMSTGKSFMMRMSLAAPIAADRFLKLALVDHYYDGLSFHRVVPNFVIQGGSPGANEYSGHQFFMRDEIGSRHSAGTVGLSTRGRNTGDAQIFINLVDNSRLDLDYTVFASVHGMSVVAAIQEGDVMQRVSSVECPKS